MELKDVVSVTGLPGLHKILGQNKNGLVLEALADGKKFSTNLRQRVSILSDISMFTDEGEVKLAQVIHQIKQLEDAVLKFQMAKSTTTKPRALWLRFFLITTVSACIRAT
jgi:hypothetical protein